MKMGYLSSKVYKTLLLGFAILTAGSLFASIGYVSALSGSDFNAGRIIDDVVFTDSSSMSAQDIQNFLNAKVPTCDTNGAQPRSYYYNSSTGEINNSRTGNWVTTSRATYGQRYDSWNGTTIAATPYVCLKGYVENPSNQQNNLQNPGASIPGGQTAAQIIYNAAQTYSINPQVLLTTLQKEQGLITDDWPWTNEYQIAMGYGCPDTAPCASQYYGFANQIKNAAAQFRNYLTNPNDFNYVIGNNTIQYNPNPSCGSSTVNIQNQATAALYDYTPYQPNAGALAGVSDSSPGGTATCGAYGNRNFWWYFNEWFGSSTRFNGSIVLQSGIALDKGIYYKGDTVHASYVISNNSDVSVNVGTVGICARINGLNYDFGTTPLTLDARASYTVSYSRTLDQNGIISVFVCSYNSTLGGWVGNFYPYSSDSIARQRDAFVYNNPLVSTNLSISPSAPTLFQPVTTTFTVQNSSSNPITIPTIGVAVRDPNGNNVGYPGDSNVTIAANSSYTYTKTRTFTGSPGNYRFWVTSFVNNNWDDNYPAADSGISRTLNTTVYDNPLITSGITISPSTPTLMQPITASFTVQNNSPSPVTIPVIGVAVRDSSGANVGYPGDTNVTIPANGSYTYSKTRTFTSNSGEFRFWVTSLINNSWNDNYPAGGPGTSRNLATPVWDNPLMTSGLTFSPSSPGLNQNVTVSFTINNYSSSPVTIPAIGVAVRDPNGANVGYPSDTNVTIPANGSYNYSKTRMFTGPAGSYRFWVTSFVNNNWDDNYPSYGPGATRSTTKTLN